MPEMSDKTLHDGRVVDDNSHDWRIECTALEVLKMPTSDARRAWLDNFEKVRGKHDADPIRERVRAIFESRKKP